MKIIKTLTRIYVSEMDNTLKFYESLLGVKAGIRFSYQAMGLELAEVGNLLIIAGPDSALDMIRETQVTFLVDSIDQFKLYLESSGCEILRGPQQVPTGKNMTVRHPDRAVFEYVEHSS